MQSGSWACIGWENVSRRDNVIQRKNLERQCMVFHAFVFILWLWKYHWVGSLSNGHEHEPLCDQHSRCRTMRTSLMVVNHWVFFKDIYHRSITYHTIIVINLNSTLNSETRIVILKHITWFNPLHKPLQCLIVKDSPNINFLLFLTFWLNFLWLYFIPSTIATHL